MRQLAINFKDNDFMITFEGVLNTILESYNRKGFKSLPFDKEQIITIINEISYGIYLLRQNQFSTTVHHNSTIKEYIKVTTSQVFIDNEVDQYINQKNGDDNQETAVVSFLDNYVYLI